VDKILNEIIEKNRRYTEYGKVASYIPELEKACKNDLGICIIDKNKKVYTAGDCDKSFTIQSVSKPILLSMILMENEREIVNKKVGFEPSDNPFNSIVSIGNNDVKKPSNPMINSGALVITSLIKGKNLKEKEDDKLEIDYNAYLSEKNTGDRNRAMAYLLKSHGFIDGNVDEVLDLYFKQCSIKVGARDLAMMGLNLSYRGYKNDDRCLISKEVSRTVMLLCLRVVCMMDQENLLLKLACKQNPELVEVSWYLYQIQWV